MKDDAFWMQRALDAARTAAQHQEVPVGAVLVHGDECITATFNQTLTQRDPTAHAEILALREGAQRLGNHRLLGTTLYVTLEPCAMCAGALLHARVSRLVYALADPKMGAVHSKACVLKPGLFPHPIEVYEGWGASESLVLLQDFFKARRRK